jgi:hypothetical protein
VPLWQQSIFKDACVSDSILTLHLCIVFAENIGECVPESMASHPVKQYHMPYSCVIFDTNLACSLTW